MFVNPPVSGRICPVFLDGALGSGRDVQETHLNLAESPEPVHRASRGSALGERYSLVIAQGRQRLDHAVVPIPAWRDDADLNGETVDELLYPVPQIDKRLGSLGLAKRWPVDWAGKLAEGLFERVDVKAKLVLTLHGVSTPRFLNPKRWYVR
jgi:hypothetical protein